MGLDVIMLATVDRDGIPLDKDRGIKTRTSGAVDHLAVHDLDIYQRGRPFRWSLPLRHLRYSGHIMASLGPVWGLEQIQDGQRQTWVPMQTRQALRNRSAEPGGSTCVIGSILYRSQGQQATH